jgi:hypothetical protein
MAALPMKAFIRAIHLLHSRKNTSCRACGRRTTRADGTPSTVNEREIFRKLQLGAPVPVGISEAIDAESPLDRKCVVMAVATTDKPCVA